MRKKTWLPLLLLCFFVFNVTTLFADNTLDMDDILGKFDSYAKQLQKEWNIPGMSVCVVKDGEVAYIKSFGYKNLNTKEKVDNKTIFQIASCTKAFTTALTAILVDKGYFKWDDLVIKYLPDFSFYDKEISNLITIEDLLSQHSNLPSYSQHYMMLFGYDKKDIVEKIRYIAPVGKFKQQYSYQNNLYLVMGEVIEKATGKSWEKNIYEYIFKPLKMANSSTDYKSYLKSKNRATGHSYYRGKLSPLPDNLAYNDWPYVFGPASAVNSNIEDMSKWLIFILNNAVMAEGKKISEENFKKLFEKKIYIGRDVYIKENKNYYCLGWRNAEYGNENIIWHAGTTDGHCAYVSFLKDKSIGTIILMNLPNGKMADSLSRKLYDMVLGNPEVNWSKLKMQEAVKNNKKKNVKKIPATIIQPLDLKKYTGEYENVLYGKAIIKIEGGSLKFSAGNKKTWITLKHFNANSFDGTGVRGWTFKRPMFVFKVDSSSSVTGIIVENMTDGIDPLFRKVK